MTPAADSSAPSWLDDLNPQQRAAVTHPGGPILVVAGAGSGKTKTLAYRVAWLISQGVHAERILLLTFTRRAAEEMISRAEAVVRHSTPNLTRAWGGTFHATANRILRIYSKAAGLSPDFTVMDESDSADMLSVVRHDLNLGSKEKRFPKKRTLRDIYSRCVNGIDSLPRVLGRHFPWCAEWEVELKQIFKEYVDRKHRLAVLDYDDLLLYWEQILRDPEVARDMGGRFDHVLVDEYQDTNPVQSKILLGLRQSNNNIMVVGDDAQSIYSFRAATVRNMLDFPKQFPGATVVTLEQNYRSVMPILKTTNLIIGQARERFTKDLWSARKEGQKPRYVVCRDEHTQDQFVVRTVLKHHEEGIPLHRQAVLFRTGHLSDSLEVELTRRNIPYRKYGGLRFLDSAHIKDLLAFIRVLENPRDEIAWIRILQLIEGVGPAAASKAVAHVHTHGNDPRSIGTFQGPAPSKGAIAGLGRLMEELVAAAEAAGPAPQIERIRKFYDPLLEKTYDNPRPRQRDIETLEGIAAGYKSRHKFLMDLLLDPPTSTSDLAGPALKDDDWLVLSTIHSAKGCEWDVVFVIHMSDGNMPSDMAAGKPEELEEELRLAYVAMTRARDHLYVSWPMQYYHRKSRMSPEHVYAQPSRFLTRQVMSSFQHLDQRYDDDSSDPTPDYESHGDDIHRHLKSRWE